MDSKIILVTGATNGLGREEAKALLAQGHTVILHGRNREKTLTVQKELVAETGNPNTDVLIADLESLAEVKAMAQEFTAKYDRLDVLVNNAGNQYGTRWAGTAEGHEKTMAVNLFAPVLLSLLLIDSLKKSPRARIVTVSSASHAQGGKPFIDDIELKDNYSFRRAYGLSKLYVIWAMRSLRKHLSEQGIETIDVNTTHPGIALTNLGGSEKRPWYMTVIYTVGRPLAPLLMRTAAQGAAPTIYAATSPEVEGLSDRYYGPKGLEQVSERHYTPANEAAVWNYCMKVVDPYLR
ncbi:SDR family NAD(P)-dependent oxidoreductase [Luedemannella flava]|uniref:SDR family NAD(P)-dependent oxidoreductase n=1 Tax=Luedemannella flava TaxID=349316 RepID=A0ABP4YPA4_9ACTN